MKYDNFKNEVDDVNEQLLDKNSSSNNDKKFKNEDYINMKETIEQNKNQAQEEDQYNKNIFQYFIYFILASLVTGVIILIITLILDKNAFSQTTNYLKSDSSILKPNSDFRKYRTILLKNGLEAVIISDPIGVTSSASLSVQVGANQDPAEFLGLAHFCEHMLFLGSQKYPNGDDYFRTVTENNGHFNAYTDREITNYFFDIHSTQFEKAMDIFSRFFIDPLFNEEKMNKEVNSVNSEFEKNLILDNRKKSQIYAYLSDHKSPFSRFTTGNLDTLIKNSVKLRLNLRDELIKFHKKFYVANKMKLIIYSNDDLDDMEDIINEKFQAIKPSSDFDGEKLMKENKFIYNEEVKNKNIKRINDDEENNNDKKNKKKYKQVFVRSDNSPIVNEDKFLINNNNNNFILKKKEVKNKKIVFNNTNLPIYITNKTNYTTNINFTNFNKRQNENDEAMVMQNTSSAELINVNGTLNNTNINETYYIYPYFLQNLGSFITFTAVTLENELSIHFLQKPWTDPSTFYNNPYLYFEYILESKDENSLTEILKKKSYATKLTTGADRDYVSWSDFVLKINLTKAGIENLKEVLEIVKAYLKYIKNNLIDEKYYNYLKKVSTLNFEYKSYHNRGNFLYQTISQIGARTQRYPLKYILDENHLVKNFNETVLLDYLKNLDLEKSIIFIPDKLIININYDFLIKESTKKEYESWYRTNFTFHKIDYTKLKDLNLNIKNRIKLIDENLIDPLINNTNKCDNKCIGNLKTLSTSEPTLLNKTNTFEFWYKFMNTLDFKKTNVKLLIKYDKFENNEEKIHILILEHYLKRKLKKLNSRLKFLTNSITSSMNNFGLKICYTSFNQNIKEVTKEFIKKINFLYGKHKIKDFNLLLTEVNDHLIKEFNEQPWSLSFQYLKKNILTEYLTSEELLRILAKIKQEDFLNFINNKFKKNYYVKLLIFGDLKENEARQIFQEFSPVLKLDTPQETKNFVYSLKEKRKNKRVSLKNTQGNYLLRKEYHQETNKNNVLLKSYKIGKVSYKNEVMVKLFNSIIGNIVFRELRINKQFGYVAKSRIDTFENYYFYSIFVQGSSRLPHLMDDAAINLMETLIKDKIEKISLKDFTSAKRKSFDTMAESRLELTKSSAQYFNEIMENTYKFYNYEMVDKYTRSLKKEDLVNFFREKFLDKDNLKFTVYVRL